MPTRISRCSAEHGELLEHDACGGAAHARRLHADRRAVERAREAEHAALLVDGAEAGVEERLGDVGRAAGIAGAEDVRGVVAGFGAQVDRHAASVESCGGVREGEAA